MFESVVHYNSLHYFKNFAQPSAETRCLSIIMGLSDRMPFFDGFFAPLAARIFGVNRSKFRTVVGNCWALAEFWFWEHESKQE